MNNPLPLQPDQFTEFFHTLWGYEPFPWQVEFARMLCAGEAPDYVTVPTGTGKTACLDGVLFALAVQAVRSPAERTVGRRIFFIVNRRIIVDEAYRRATSLVEKLASALTSEVDLQNNIVAKVAWWLRSLAGGESATPLACTELRGGIYRDRAWAQSLIQPMIVCSTVDQAGSRLLFRGYGVSAESRPIHAALVAHDSLLLIDEAHISQPFVETLRWVARYRSFQMPGGETVAALPFSIVCMTATPPQSESNPPRTLGLSDPADCEHPVLKPRLTCKKLARLVPEPKAKGKQWNEKLAERLVAEALGLVSQHNPSSLAIMVNRVATAREAYKKIKEKVKSSHPSAEVTLLLGRMRPLDRDSVTRQLEARLKTLSPTDEQRPQAPLRIVVSTQCLEVGADLDFDALVTECASFDALRQRFGRLNRAGRPFTAHAVIVLPEEQNAAPAKLSVEKPLDPIYGNAIPHTWSWLRSIATDDVVDFGLSTMSQAVDSFRAENQEAFAAMLTPVGRAPVMLPAYLDCWVQTNPEPAADPDVALFLHGPQRDMAEVQACWRADLPDNDDEDAWAETLSLCPPTTLECLPVPLPLLRRWLEGNAEIDESGDAPQTSGEAEDNRQKPGTLIRAMLWRGATESRFVDGPHAFRPGDTIVLRTQDGGWTSLGHIPNSGDDPQSNADARLDRGEEGQARMHRRAFVRIHPELWNAGEEGSPTWQLLQWATDEDIDWNEIDPVPVLNAAADLLGSPADDYTSLSTRLRHLAKWAQRGKLKRGLEVERSRTYPGVVLSVRELLPGSTELSRNAIPDDGSDDPLLGTVEPQTLSEHTEQVIRFSMRYARSLGMEPFADALEKAASLHDTGKADRRFQALLLGSDVAAAFAQPVVLAKSAAIPTSRTARESARKRATLPAGFRHEMLSLQLAESSSGTSLLADGEDRKQLILHLIASHHGYARPFAPVVEDDSPPEVSVTIADIRLKLDTDARTANPAHALDSGVADRFWQMTRRHGWWGLALLETILRLADQTASATPQNATKA